MAWELQAIIMSFKNCHILIFYFQEARKILHLSTIQSLFKMGVKKYCKHFFFFFFFCNYNCCKCAGGFNYNYNIFQWQPQPNSKKAPLLEKATAIQRLYTQPQPNVPLMQRQTNRQETTTLPKMVFLSWIHVKKKKNQWKQTQAPH